MKKALAVAALVASSLIASPALAAETMRGTIVKVDEGARTITFRKERSDKDDVLAVDASVSLKGVKEKAGAKITVDAGVVKGIEPDARPRAAAY